MSANDKIIRGKKIEEIVLHAISSENTDRETMIELRNKAKTLQQVWDNAENKGYQRGLKDGHLQGYEVGRSEGLDLGYRAGVEKAAQEMHQTVTLLLKMAEEIKSKKQEILEMLKPDFIKFILIVAEKIIRTELKNPHTTIQLLEKIFQQAKPIMESVPVNIVLSPEDHKMILANFSTLEEAKHSQTKIHFIADSTLERGNFRVDTPLGMVNYDINRMLKDLEVKTLEA